MPITADTRVSDALAQRPELRDVLPAFHPAFARLQHPVLGRVLPRLVTVADAARIAGVDVDALVGVMNCPLDTALPVDSADTHAPGGLPRAPRPPDAPRPAWYDPARVTVLDARPVLDAGEDPLARVLTALRRLPPGGQLTVLAPFEPVPLVGLLARQGWTAWIRWEDDTCLVTFARDGQPPATVRAAPARSHAVPGPAGWILDVRFLPPPEPLLRVLAALDAGQLPLTVLHAREPAMLYPHLAQRGLEFGATAREDGVSIEIRRA